MKKYLLATVALAAGVAFSGAAMAEATHSIADDIYVRADGGYSFGMGDANNAGVFDVGVGMRINQYVKADVIAEYRPWGRMDFKGDGKSDMYSLDGMVNLYASYPVWDAFSVYGTGGIGYAYNNTDNMTGFKGKATNNFAWNVGAGVEYAVTPCMVVDLGYRFSDLGKAEVKNLTTGGKATEDVRYSDIKLGLQYYF